MQVSGQNLQPQKQQVVQTQTVTQPTAACPQPQPQAPAPQVAYNPVQNTIYPQYQPQNVQVPSTAAGVNIQIFNPSVSTPGAQPPAYNVNAPCYPANYYTGSVGADGRLTPNNSGVSNPHTGDNVNNGTNSGTIGDNNHNSYTTNNNSTINNNTENSGETGKTDDKKKTEKRKIVELTDEYIMNLENHLNSQEKPIRLNAAKEVYARLKEDDSRHDDKALNALINKMLQDPSEEIRVLALSALEERIVTGDDYTVNVLKNMQQNANAYGQDAIDASNILLKMSGRQVDKEFEVKDKPKTEENKENKESKKA
jgi:hypothetical protein